MLNNAVCFSSMYQAAASRRRQNRFSRCGQASPAGRWISFNLREPLWPGGPGEAVFRPSRAKTPPCSPPTCAAVPCRVGSVGHTDEVHTTPADGFMRVDGMGLWKSALEQQILFLVLPHWHLVVDLAIVFFKNILLVYALQMSIGRHFLEAFHLAVYTFCFNNST